MFNSKSNIWTGKVLLLLLLFVFAGQVRLFAKKSASLPELMQPFMISTNDSHLYVADNETIFIYFLNTFKFIKKVGKRGEGPGEFKLGPLIRSYANFLSASDMGKIIIYSLNGKLLREERMPPKFAFSNFVYPVGNNFAVFQPNRTSGNLFFTITLLDNEFNFIKELARVKRSLAKRGSFEPITDYFRHEVLNDRIYIADSSKGFYIDVFDSNGTKQYTIDKKYEKIKITDQVKQDIEKEMDSSKLDRMIKKRSRIVYKEYFPAIQHFRVNGGKIYVFTYKEKGTKQEVVILDLKGSIQKRVFVTKPEGRLFSISNNTYYYLLENETKEEWELHLENLQSDFL